VREAQSILGAVNKDVGQLADVKIPALIKEKAALQTVSILRGDYDLKIARQDYFTTNQDKVDIHSPRITGGWGDFPPLPIVVQL